MDYEHVDFPSAVRRLAARAGIPVVEERSGSAEDDRQHEARRTLLKLHAEAAEWFHENLLKRDVAEPARDYLKKRGINERGGEIVAAWFRAGQLGRLSEMGARCRLQARHDFAERPGQAAR